MKPRVDGLSVAQRLFRYVRERRASVTAALVAAEFGLSHDGAHANLVDGVAAGWLTATRVRIGRSWTKFYALRPGARRPRDRRGAHSTGGWLGNPASLANLRNGARFPRPLLRRRHPLERAWKAPAV